MNVDLLAYGRNVPSLACLVEREGRNKPSDEKIYLDENEDYDGLSHTLRTAYRGTNGRVLNVYHFVGI